MSSGTWKGYLSVVCAALLWASCGTAGKALINAGIVRKPAGAPPVELGVNGSLMGWPIAVFFLGIMTLITGENPRTGFNLTSLLVATVGALVVIVAYGFIRKSLKK